MIYLTLQFFATTLNNMKKYFFWLRHRKQNFILKELVGLSIFYTFLVDIYSAMILPVCGARANDTHTEL